MKEEELPWDKGGPGVVWYTDAQFWDEMQGDFDAKTADDVDIDITGYLNPGLSCHVSKPSTIITIIRADNDSHEAHQLRSIYTSENIDHLQRTRGRHHDPDGPDASCAFIRGAFERHSKAVGSRILKQQGWREGAGIGRHAGIADPIEHEGQPNWSKAGFGFDTSAVVVLLNAYRM